LSQPGRQRNQAAGGLKRLSVPPTQSHHSAGAVRKPSDGKLGAGWQGRINLRRRHQDNPHIRCIRLGAEWQGRINLRPSTKPALRSAPGNGQHAGTPATTSLPSQQTLPNFAKVIPTTL
ncbi:MAG: hypothetical protein SNJ49_14540, partial [Chloracidobacterium sp.]